MSEFKTYTGKTTVKARPVTVKDAEKNLGIAIKLDELPENTGLGFEVVERDGKPVHEFIPKNLFEFNYHSTDTFKDRLLIEFRELQERHKKLEAFVFSDKLFSVQPPVQQKLLLEQEKVMGKYLTLLELRLRLIDPEIDKVL